ncbi:cytadherence high molecular weight protein 1 [Pyrus x bretschneideri]|uniref:cytadherence high molecular weight protein 1 n=1 Tax=Pyrus x bretschneideri TaxID=225117 RepID=UPI00202F3B86|nr:cytadherence high molecular weight protein 1 [Pyrus x bretschneideri]
MSWLASLKIVLISSGVVALALAMKLFVPMATEFVASHVPVMCSSFLSLFRPPYLYVLINCIIITIAASSRFQGRSPQPKLQPESEASVSEPPAVYEPVYREPEVVHELKSAVVIKPESEAVYEPRYREPEVVSKLTPESEAVSEPRYREPEVVHELTPESEVVSEPRYREPEVVYELTSAVVINGYVEEAEPEAAEIEDGREYEDKLVILPPKSMVESDAIALPVEKPPVSARFSHRKPARSIPEGGKPLRVAKPKRNDTLENTWKAITEGRSMPLSRHTKKSETLPNHGRQLKVDLTSAVDTSVMVKAETFKEPTNQSLTAVTAGDGSGGRLRKEPSLSQDELNRQVEAFINKFNEEMRMQRQQSLDQYKKMVNGGSH